MTNQRMRRVRTAGDSAEMRNALRSFLLQVMAAVCLVGSIQPAIADAYRFSGASRVVAVSDPHGAHDAFVATLGNAGVLDDSGHWSGGETHLVITGDLLDRGADSRRIMDLVMQLEDEAKAAGGRVHLTLGNHEVMNLVGDLRYVATGEYAAFADEEPAAERERRFRDFVDAKRNAVGADVDEAALRAAFERDRPPGFYGHRMAFASDGRYGRWLLSKPVMVVVNGTAYVHGGLPELVAEHDLDGLNDLLTGQVRDYVAALETLTDAGIIDPALNFYEHPAAAAAARAGVADNAELVAAIDAVVALGRAAVHDAVGPLWYRGTVACSEPAERDVLDAALRALDAERVVIGHTPTVTRRVLSRFGGRVIEIDTGMLKAAYGGSGNALVIDGGSVSVHNQSGGSGTPLVHPRRVGSRADHLSAERLEAILANGDVSDPVEDESGVAIVTVRDGDDSITARFVISPRRDGLVPQLAAYRLDRLLGLEMVPVTVQRTVGGKRGTLQFLPAETANEAQRAAAQQGGGAWCPLLRQWNSMYLFDALAYNEGRAATDMLYSPDNWQLLLTGNGNTFTVRPRIPGYLEQAPMALNSAWREALEALTDERIDRELGDVLDPRRLSALGERRDLLLSR